jgi:hypothetical protein
MILAFEGAKTVHTSESGATVITRDGSMSSSTYSIKSENPKRNNSHLDVKTAPVIFPTNDRYD